MSTYKRAKYQVSRANEQLDIARAELVAHQTELKVNVNLDKLSECEPDDSD